MAGKKKDPIKIYSPKWGGEYRGGGLKASPFPKQTIIINCTKEEKQAILEALTNPRQRAEILLNWIETEPSKPHVIY